ncbi:hypothetical protein FE374_04915 [Georgenia yuyongxinii]|uniref:Uncharacterized protein n=1 Tax=Georgenia yuyongxinii TaxID=2589797 RepID=A0A5B8C1R3_9MICO|nr:hypothetical protein [Georgenia yuyongxinii]QDC24057.1 hypothetical protein FE374_04915 [Georgenia yuyongxinii]
MVTWSRLSLTFLLAPWTRPVRGPSPAPSRAGGAAELRLAAHGPRGYGPVASAPHPREMSSSPRDVTSAASSTPPPATRPAPAPPTPGARAGLPVTLGGAPARQSDQTTCGSTALLMLAATGDRVLADWLEHGTLPPELLPHRVPPEIPPAALGGTAQPGPAGVTARLTAAQRHVRTRTSAAALGPAPWPGSLGTPPWTAAREARFPGVRYRSVPLADTTARARTLLTSVHGATLAGVPVPLYTGGDLGRGLTTAVPRHVVLAVPPPAAAAHRGHDDAGRPVLHLYDPASGRVYPVLLDELLDREGPHPALGGWSHVVWVVLPEPVHADAA